MVVETRFSLFSLFSVCPFSILGRIVVVETAKPAEGRIEKAATFSILGRIVVVETRQTFGSNEGGPNFQYPRTDRGG